MKTGAIILAAGAPGEIQEAKPMLCVGQKPMIKQIVELLEGLSVRPIVVVAGYRYDIIGRALQIPALLSCVTAALLKRICLLP